MKRTMQFMLIIAAAMLWPYGVYADYYDGYRLNQMADAHDRVSSGRGSVTDAVESSVLIGYVVGMADAFGDLKWACVPSNVRAGQLVSMVKKYVRDNPDKWNHGSSKLVGYVLYTSYPCKR